MRRGKPDNRSHPSCAPRGKFGIEGQSTLTGFTCGAVVAAGVVNLGGQIPTETQVG
jgi:hypothetical protein